jgi:hypothetical protein
MERGEIMTTQTKQAHKSTPVEVIEIGGKWFIRNKESNRFICEAIDEANAQFIVKCVNAHNELVRVLKEVSSLMTSEMDAHGDSDILNEALTLIKQVLKKAGE